MDAKTYLMQYKLMTARIATAEQELADLRSAREAVSSKLDGMPRGSGIRDRVAALAAQIADREEEVLELQEQAQAVRDDIVRTLDRLGDPTYHTLLYLRYIKDCSWEVIASKIYYSREWTSRTLHDKALDALQKILH